MPVERPTTRRNGHDVPVPTFGVPTPAAPSAAAVRRARRRAERPGTALALTMLGIILMGFSRTRVAGWTISDLAFLAAAGVMVIDVLSGRDGQLAPKRSRRSSPPVLLGAIVLLTAGTVSAFQSWNAVESILIVLRFAWITLGFFWVLRAGARGPEGLAKLLTAWRIMVLLNCAIAITGQLGLTNFSTPNAENRQTGFFLEPNELAGLVAIGLPLFLLGVPARRAYRSEGREMVARMWPVAAILYAIATTGSMTGLIAAFAGCVTLFLAGGWRHIRRPTRRDRSPLLSMIVGFIVVVGLVALASSDLPVVDRFTRYTEGDSGVSYSVNSREERNSQVIQRFDESLVVGQGFGSYNPNDPGASDAAGAHNMFFRFIFQAGLPGLIGVLIILLFTLQHALALLRNTRGDPLHATAIALLGCFGAANTFAMFQPTEYHRYYWISVAMVGVLWAVRREQMRVQDDARRVEIDAINRLPTRRISR
jgi:O-antigen ligase